MKFHSITFKLLFFIGCAFALTTVSVLALADIQLKQILDKSQESVYQKKIDGILGLLTDQVERLKKTGLVEAYEDDFKASAVKNLTRYSQDSNQNSFSTLVVLDGKGRIVMSRQRAAGSQAPIVIHSQGEILSSSRGNFNYTFKGKKHWCIFKRFAPWDWIIAYTLPLEIKYANARTFSTLLFFIMAGISLFATFLLSLVVTRFTKPITRLTRISTRMAAGNLDQEIDLAGKDEIGVLANSFSLMRDSIKEKISGLSRLGLIMESTSDLVSMATPEAGILYINHAGKKLLGWPEDTDVRTKQIPDLHPARAMEIIQTHGIPTAMEKGIWKGETAITGPDGREIPVSQVIMAHRSDTGELEYLSTIMRDITERKAYETELNKLRNYLSNIIDSMPSVLIGVDAGGRVTQWNKTAEKATGIKAATAHGKALSEVFPRMSPQMEQVAESIQTREVRHGRKNPRQSKGGTHYEDVTIYPLVTNGVEGAVIRLDDVTEKVRLEEMMVQSEKMLSVGGLAAGMAHEINNPLAGMLQTASVMERRLSCEKKIPANIQAAREAGTSMEAIQSFMKAREIPRMLETIHQSGLRVADIVDNMLSFARKGDAMVSPTSLEDLLDKTLGLAATDYDLKKEYDFKLIQIIREYQNNTPMVPCEKGKIQQVLLNILRNGAQAMQEAGIEQPRFIVRTRFHKENDRVCMEIEDNGPGMDEKTRKRIFEPFFTTKPVGVGTGLGLSVSYFIIKENHGGDMQVQSRPGAGSKFIICLPLERRLRS
ncbi:PAS domain S-box protein [Desulfospira joergensenii]|uniref:PAS domain S-box protein n=1 Tax=Desulfospira joergensenii TaxID=53329 RepID=UPI0003B5B6B3|nr:PAS domain S-box protein [Desulfospira joergensenii]